MPEAGELAAQRRAAANEAAQHVRTLFLSFLFAGGYLAVTVAGTDDTAFLADAPIHLPVIGVEIHTVAFFTIAPWAFVLLHLNFLFNVYLLWRKLEIHERAVAALPPEMARAERLQVFPQLFCQAAVRQPYPRAIRTLMDVAVGGTAIVLPFALVFVSALRFHGYPEPALVDIPRLAVVADLLIVGFFAVRLAAVRRAMGPGPARPRRTNWWLRGWTGLSARRSWRERGRFLHKWLRLGPRFHPPEVAFANLGLPVMAMGALYLLAEAMIGLPHLSLDLRKAVLVDAATPEAAVREAREAAAVPPPGLDKIVGIDLTGHVLARASFEDAFMPKARLRGADLREADLSRAHLVAADLVDADLRGARLRNVRLHDARLRGADLRGANLKGAILSGADLRKADLRNADLAYAKLTGANLAKARLEGVSFAAACGQDANLPGQVRLPRCGGTGRRRMPGGM